MDVMSFAHWEKFHKEIWQEVEAKQNNGSQGLMLFKIKFNSSLPFKIKNWEAGKSPIERLIHH